VTPVFKEPAKDELAPLLRDHGFRGSGPTLRRVSDVVCKCPRAGARAGDSCASRSHLISHSCRPIVEELPDPRKIVVCDWSSVAARSERRLRSLVVVWRYRPRCGTVGRLPCRDVLQRLERTGLNWHRVSREVLARYAQLAQAGDLSLLPGPTTVARAALAMARIALHRSMPGEARDFVEVACRPRAHARH